MKFPLLAKHSLRQGLSRNVPDSVGSVCAGVGSSKPHVGFSACQGLGEGAPVSSIEGDAIVVPFYR